MLGRKFQRNCFFIEGQITGFGTFVFIFAGMTVIYFSLEYLTTYELKIMGLCFGLVMMALGGLGARASAIGLRSFTNDPLGWRKAKESYKENEAEEVLNQLEDASAKDSKK